MDSTGDRAAKTDVFTADDLVAVSLLSVEVPAQAAIELLDTRHDEFTSLLRLLGPDCDLVTIASPWPDDAPAWQLWAALSSLPGVGPTTASKLYARKRPRLRPIYDSVVDRVIDSRTIWEPLRLLRQDDLHQRLVRLRDDASLPTEVSAIRVFDVLAWMEGSGNTPCAASSSYVDM